MKKIKILAIQLLIIQASFSQLNDPAFSIIFQDEFNGTSIDLTKWTVGSGSRENNHICTKPGNVVVNNGNLECWARKENYLGYQYTESEVTSRFSFTKGFYMEVRCKLANGPQTNTGAWIWGGLHDNNTTCNNCFNYDGTILNKKCGCQNYNEVDFYEYYGDVQQSTGQYHTCHVNGNCVKSQGKGFTVDNPNSQYHIASLFRNDINSSIYLDGRLMDSRNTPSVKSTSLVLYFWLRSYVNSSQPLPEKTLFDYVRVYRLIKSNFDCTEVINNPANLASYTYNLKRIIRLNTTNISPNVRHSFWAINLIELGGGNTNFDIPVSNQEITFAMGECW